MATTVEERLVSISPNLVAEPEFDLDAYLQLCAAQLIIALRGDLQESGTPVTRTVVEEGELGYDPDMITYRIKMEFSA